MYFMEYFRHYLVHRHFFVLSDHKLLLNPNEKTEELNRPIEAWLDTIIQYRYSVIYIPEKKTFSLMHSHAQPW